jgi:hypothetical protein
LRETFHYGRTADDKDVLKLGLNKFILWVWYHIIVELFSTKRAWYSKHWTHFISVSKCLMTNDVIRTGRYLTDASTRWWHMALINAAGQKRTKRKYKHHRVLPSYIPC